MSVSAFELVRADTGDSTRVFSVRVPPDCPYFRGHFPSRPVLPAIGQLALVVELMERGGSGPVWIAGAENLRFLRPIKPGDELIVRVDLALEGEAAFRIERDGERISEGRLLWRAVDAA